MIFLFQYQGNFEIISLSGSYSLSDDNGSLNQVGSLSVSLSGPDGQVLGGVVAGELIAATPVQVILSLNFMRFPLMSECLSFH